MSRFIVIIVPQDLPNIGPRFANPWNFPTLYSMHPGIVRSQGQRQIAFVQIQQMTQLFGAASDILQRVIDISHPQGGRRIRRQLHQADGPFVRHDMLAKV